MVSLFSSFHVKHFLLTAALFGCTISSTFAHEAPVTDLSLAPQPMAEEISTLKRQITHLLENNLSGRVEALQQEVQMLRGTLEKQNHDMQILQTQLKQLQQSLDSRMDQSNKTSSARKEKIELVPFSEYKQALKAIQEKKYLAAQNLLIQHLALHPKDQSADHAHFWLGEVYYHQKKRQLAKREFEIIQRDFPASPKLASALLKIGFIEVEEDNLKTAKAVFSRIFKSFPGTSSAHLAKMKLEKLSESEQEKT